MNLSEMIPKFERKLRFVNRSSEATIKNYLSSINLFIREVGDKDVKDISTRDVEEFVIKLGEKGYKPTSINRHLSAIKSFLKYIGVQVDWEQLEGRSRSPTRSYDYIILDDEEVEAIIEYARQKNKMWGLMLALGYEAMLRAGELVNLKTSDVDFERCMVMVRVEKRPEPQEKPISMTLCKELRNYVITSNLKPSDYLFYTKFGKPWNPSTFSSYVFERILDELEINKKYLESKGRKVRYHDFARHTRATKLLRDGVDIYTVNRLLGHRSLQSTLVYLHFVGEDLRRRLKERQ